jgi:nucleoside-triphosphatase THEP1
MRGTNGPMNIITRAEFDHSMKDVLSKADLQAALAGTSAEVASIKDKLDDIKVDLLDSIETKIRQTKSSIAFQTVTKSDLDDAKVEILATTRRNIAEAVDQGVLKNAARLDAMEHKINTIVIDGCTSMQETMKNFTAEVRAIVKHHEQRLDRHDADLYKLRQSGVLQ